MYFVSIFVIQVFAIVSAEVGSTFILFDVWTYFAQVFNVIFLTRFMLNLRGIYVAQSPDDDINTAPSFISDIHFATIIGNLGAPLDTPAFISNQDTNSDDSDTVEISSNPLIIGLSPKPPDHIELRNTDRIHDAETADRVGASSEV
ncbi:hypothetical protein EUX98_g7864 [Antrodiella citrinella]|uniref:Uncharacterized protein n=1 Tax=Antrodiella citrinella TaxID=2447956 RepID=A0A4S4MSJ3_9APHY|nr:hypothetical protein EUX98_g7864 [Antrodiella citrinella]